MPSRKIEDLHPCLQPLAVEFLRLCEMSGLEILITCTYRDNAEQNLLYSYGRTVPNPNGNPKSTVTNARGGESEHNFTLNGKPAAKAFDVVPLVNGEPMWDTRHISWLILGNVWRKGIQNSEYYLDWLGRSTSPYKDFPHFSLKRATHEVRA